MNTTTYNAWTWTLSNLPERSTKPDWTLFNAMRLLANLQDGNLRDLVRRYDPLQIKLTSTVEDYKEAEAA